MKSSTIGQALRRQLNFRGRLKSPISRVAKHRRLTCEGLEGRQLLAAWSPSQSCAALQSDDFAQTYEAMPAEKASGAVTSNATSPLVKYFLTARDADDNLLPVVNGAVEVGVGIENSFFLEVAYSDLRTFGDDSGAFSVYVDLGVSQSSILRPVLREAQQIVFGEEVYSATSGSLTIGLEGSTQTFVSDFAMFADEPMAAFQAALNQFGYQPSQYRVRGVSSSDLRLEIRYVDPSFANLDLPNLTVTSNFDVTVPTSVKEFSPVLADGVTPNSAAVRFNLDTRSRTFNDNQNFYFQLNRGHFDMATGFIDIGGTGLIGEGIRGLSDDGQFIEPFDVFRVEVFLSDSLSSPLVINANHSEGVDALLLYGIDEIISADSILLDADASVTLVTAEPTVQRIEINDGVESRSQVTSLSVTFSDELEFALLQNAFTLVNTDTATPVSVINLAATLIDGKTSVRLTFDGDSTINRPSPGSLGNSLTDGNYRLTIDASNIRSSRGFMMLNNFDFGEQSVDGFFRLYGDSDGDRDVDGQDFGRFGLTFLKTIGNSGLNTDLDSDGDGDVDGQDYARFRSNFLKRI